MRPRNTMSNVKIITSITTYVYYEYDLTSEESKFISTMYTSGIYKFYISVEYAQIVDIEFIKSDSSYTSYQYINFFEYSTRTSTTELTKDSNTLSYNSTKNTYSKSYTINKSSTTYLAFQIIPSKLPNDFSLCKGNNKISCL